MCGMFVEFARCSNAGGCDDALRTFFFFLFFVAAVWADRLFMNIITLRWLNLFFFLFPFSFFFFDIYIFFFFF